uniref:Ribosomal protein L2 n=1 Tax=Thraustochytrium aureum TaxID=42467 RepID=Q9G4C8_9STRA|nr:ribosomal protein L2 [Thraustochytrium aureum]
MNINLFKIGKKNSSGRNNQGRITSRHRGGGHKRKLLKIDFFRKPSHNSFKVLNFFYDPNRSCKVIIVHNVHTFQPRIVLAPKGAFQGINLFDFTKENPSNSIGCSQFFHNINVGSYVYSIQSTPNSKMTFIRSAGSQGQVVKKDHYFTFVKIPSSEVKKFSSNCRACLGQVGNESHFLSSLMKAGESRWRNKRPKVRGVAMNPVDHPHGGGEGKGRVGRHPVSPWGKLTLGKKTRK